MKHFTYLTSLYSLMQYFTFHVIHLNVRIYIPYVSYCATSLRRERQKIAPLFSPSLQFCRLHFFQERMRGPYILRPWQRLTSFFFFLSTIYDLFFFIFILLYHFVSEEDPSRIETIVWRVNTIHHDIVVRLICLYYTPRLRLWHAHRLFFSFCFKIHYIFKICSKSTHQINVFKQQFNVPCLLLGCLVNNVTNFWIAVIWNNFRTGMKMWP